MDKSRQCIDQGHCPPRHRATKDRQRWCKGRDGVEHQWVWTNVADVPNAPTWRSREDVRPSERPPFWEQRTRQVEFCAPCGRQRDTRSICHCGEVMTLAKKQGRGRWFADLVCTCGFHTGRFYDFHGERIIRAGRPVHTCEPVHLQRLQQKANEAATKVAAVDPHAASTGKLSTRESDS